MPRFSGRLDPDSDSEGDSSTARVLLNPEHPLFGVLPYEELLNHLWDHHPHPLHTDQLLLTELAQDLIAREQEAHLKREQTGE